MRAISFEHNGKPSFGLLNERGVIDVGARLSNQFVDLRSILMAGALKQLCDLSSADVDFAEADINYLPVIPNASNKS